MEDQTVGREAQVPERELRELREREAAYRDRLTSSTSRMRELREATAAIMEVLRRTPPQRAELVETLTEVAKLSRRALGVQRASIWMLDAAGGELRCTLQIRGESHSPEHPVLRASDSPSYFRALAGTGVVVVEDTERDLRTAGLDAYLRAHDVGALLDISIAIPGELVGVVCHEHAGGPREWHPEEVDFATHVGNLVALTIEAERRHAAQSKTASAEARYRYLVESLPVTVYSFDAFSSRLEYLSPQFHELRVFEPDEALAKGVAGWLEVIHPEDRRMVEARFAPHGVDAVPAEITYRVLPPAGGIRYVRDHCRVVRNHAGDPIAIQGVLADVTEQRKIENRAAELERRLRSLLENVDLLAVVLDRDGRLEFVNAEFEKVMGYRASEVIGVDGFDLLVSPAEAKSTRERFLRDLVAGTLASHFENEVVTRAGERRHVMWTNTLLRDDTGAAIGCCSLGLDVTDRVRMEADLLQQSKMESLGQLSAGVAHDYNNLLTVLTYGLETLARNPAEALRRDTVELMQKALTQAADLTKSLLVYARRDTVSPRAVGVDDVLRDAAPLLAALFGKGVALGTSLHAEGARVLIDPPQLRQVVLNLAANARDATRGYGNYVEITTGLEHVDDALARRHGALAGGSYVVVSVKDDGRGMDRHTLTRIFEPFFTTKERGQGTGLGLAMCHSIVRGAGGFIVVESEPGSGTTCRVHLPAAPSPSSMAAGPGPSSAPPPSGRTSALVVEDEGVVRAQLAATLEEMGLHVVTAGTIAEARRIIADRPVDLLITDGSLSDGLGRILARAARAARPSVRVLLVSGAAEPAEEFDATLSKPFTREELANVVRPLLPRPPGDPG